MPGKGPHATLKGSQQCIEADAVLGFEDALAPKTPTRLSPAVLHRNHGKRLQQKCLRRRGSTEPIPIKGYGYGHRPHRLVLAPCSPCVDGLGQVFAVVGLPFHPFSSPGTPRTERLPRPHTLQRPPPPGASVRARPTAPRRRSAPCCGPRGWPPDPADAAGGAPRTTPGRRVYICRDGRIGLCPDLTGSISTQDVELEPLLEL